MRSCQTAAASTRIVSSYPLVAVRIHSFPIRSKEMLRIMYLKCPVLEMIQRIHLHRWSFGSMIRFWILGKKRNIRFRIKDPDFALSNSVLFTRFHFKVMRKSLYLTIRSVSGQDSHHLHARDFSRFVPLENISQFWPNNINYNIDQAYFVKKAEC